MEVRRISPEEWPLLRELRLASLSESPEAFGQTLDNALAEPDDTWRSAARASTAGDRRAWFIARHGGRAVGLVQARRRPPHDCLIFSMWVAPAARRHGAGTALIETVARWGLGWGAEVMVLWVYGANESAQRFYERIGFAFVNSGPDAEAGRSFGALAMSRALEPM